MDILSEAKTVLFTGNLRQCAASAAKPTRNSTADMLSALDSSLSSWKRVNPDTQISAVTEVIGNPQLLQSNSVDDVSQASVTVKLVLLDGSGDSMKEAIASIRKALSLQTIDLVILSLNEPSSETLPANFLGVWQALESERAAGHVKELGVADLNAPQLSALLSSVTVKPVVDQLPFDVPCSYKDEAVKRVALDAGIRLMSHDDAHVLVPVNDFETTAKKQVGVPLTPRWVARYSVLDEGRSVLANFGYAFGVSSILSRTVCV